jgi:hypothetical protein
MNKPWPISEVVALKEHAAAGLSSMEIAQKLGRTRNEIIGKCYRIGVKLHGRSGFRLAKHTIRRLPGRTSLAVIARDFIRWRSRDVGKES